MPSKVEQIVRAVRDGNDAAIRTLLADLASAADTAALLYLRERLYATQGPAAGVAIMPGRAAVAPRRRG
ncbi:hypothetical protein OG806_48255 [Streptomyces sp. NBC_00882]|uniref:hypothetical protein n=1 Tax=Streptomyces TaxID=1883 RepID=UPI00386E1CE3|nr:hypothetical protein OG806_48255 [Streptomyces sp. NBC_00882]WSZ63574.1 hypothetical protein OH824_47095 [Streptomyces canus]